MGILESVKNVFRSDDEEIREVAEEAPEAAADTVATEEAVVSLADTISDSVAHVLMQPHVTEKSTEASERGVYVFRVHPKATKPQVRVAVEQSYDVHVDSVRTIRVPAKQRRRGRFTGVRSGYKKAMVTLSRGQHIDSRG